MGRGDRRGATPLAGLTRVRGGTFSPTVGLVRFTDGSTAHTDLVRLTPNVDAYSLDIGGTSPRRLAHYREVAWHQAPLPTARWWQREIALILTNGYPRVSTDQLTRRLREAGYPVGSATIREHEAIAATQAALWFLTNGLELDTRALDGPVKVSARIGEHPNTRSIVRHSGAIDWLTRIPTGEPVYLEIELSGRPELESFSFIVGPHAELGDIRVHLERSLDGRAWYPVSHSTLRPSFSAGCRISKPLGSGSTLASADAVSGRLGYRHYRLVVSGPADREGLLDLRDIRLDLSGGRRFRNSERIIHLYDLLLSRARDAPPATPARLLIGSPTPSGPSFFTPLVTLTDDALRPLSPDHQDPGEHS
jgi:TQXA domain-containing protein